MRIYSNRTLILLILFGSLLSNISYSQDDDENDSNDSNPLSSFENFIGGEWHLEDSYQIFSWGVGKKSVKADSYFLIDDEPQKVSEGFWFWHPKGKKIKGYFTAINMSVELFDLTTVFEGNTMKSDLRSYTTDGKEEEYIETWELTDNDTYEWSLFSVGPDGEKKVMGGKYTRKFNLDDDD